MDIKETQLLNQDFAQDSFWVGNQKNDAGHSIKIQVYITSDKWDAINQQSWKNEWFLNERNNGMQLYTEDSTIPLTGISSAENFGNGGVY